jgi:hypothetical protein
MFTGENSPMHTKYILIIASVVLAGCNPSTSMASGDFELLGDACKALGNAEKRKQCLVVLEKMRGESKAPSADSSKPQKPQATRVPITFKDVPLGQAGVKAALSEICKQDKSNEPSTYDKTERCEFQKKRNIIWLSYGNLGHTLAVIELGDGDALDSVEIGESKGAMLGLAEILKDKYGPPKKTTNSVENKMGTKFDQDIFVWVDAQGNRITVESIYDKIDQGRVVIESATRVAARGVAEKLLKEVGKSNL